MDAMSINFNSLATKSIAFATKSELPATVFEKGEDKEQKPTFTKKYMKLSKYKRKLERKTSNGPYFFE